MSAVLALLLLYTAQGVPFGLASEYLPVRLRQAHFSMTMIGAVGWLQLPWQLKVLWAHAADGPLGRRHGRALLLGLQLALAVAVAAFALAPLSSAATQWFALTAVCATLAASQDVFVDALAVRTLGPAQRGLGNTAQVAGYRVGMLVGGAGLLLLAGPLGERGAILGCAALVAATSLAAFRLRDPGAGPRDPGDLDEGGGALAARRSRVADLAHTQAAPWSRMLAHLVRRDTWPVLALALTYKLGMHLASVLIKPMAVDARWSDRDIGLAVVTFGIGAALLGALAGGLLHGRVSERRALALGALLQAAVCVPLLCADRLGAPLGWTTAAIAVEHFATGLGTTVLFAALMSATRPADAGLHYTLLTSANALAIGLGSTGGGLLADALGRAPVFALSALCCLAPLALLPAWERASRASRS